MTLAVSRLRCERGGRVLFNELNIALKSGEVLQIVGPNGCGKTSLLRILAGLLIPHAGEVRWDEQLIHECGTDYQQAVCYIGHKNAVKLGLTVLEQLQFYARLRRGLATLELTTLMQQFSLWSVRHRRGEHLSAGQRQRLALARLALSGAPLWILDEPFTALDVAGIQLLTQVMAQHLAHGGQIVLTSHQPLTWQPDTLHQLTLGS